MKYIQCCPLSDIKKYRMFIWLFAVVSWTHVDHFEPYILSHGDWCGNIYIRIINFTKLEIHHNTHTHFKSQCYKNGNKTLYKYHASSIDSVLESSAVVCGGMWLFTQEYHDVESEINIWKNQYPTHHMKGCGWQMVTIWHDIYCCHQLRHVYISLNTDYTRLHHY